MFLENHDSVNLNYDTRRYQYNNSIQGGEGKYLKYTLTQSMIIIKIISILKMKRFID